MADAPDPAAQDHSEGSRNRTNSRVEHEYIDYAVEAALLESQQRAYDPGEAPSSNDPFPIYLHYILHQTEKAGLSHIVSWCPHGRAFVVHNRELFVRTVLPKYFSQSRYTSFQRQLSLYGFLRITRGPDQGGYYNPKFLRISRTFARNIRRVKIKNEGPRKSAAPELEPDFYAMPSLSKSIQDVRAGENPTHPSRRASSEIQRLFTASPIAASRSTPQNSASLSLGSASLASIALPPDSLSPLAFPAVGGLNNNLNFLAQRFPQTEEGQGQTTNEAMHQSLLMQNMRQQQQTQLRLLNPLQFQNLLLGANPFQFQNELLGASNTQLPSRLLSSSMPPQNHGVSHQHSSSGRIFPLSNLNLTGLPSSLSNTAQPVDAGPSIRSYMEQMRQNESSSRASSQGNRQGVQDRNLSQQERRLTDGETSRLLLEVIQGQQGSRDADIDDAEDSIDAKPSGC